MKQAVAEVVPSSGSIKVRTRQDQQIKNWINEPKKRSKINSKISRSKVILTVESLINRTKVISTDQNGR